MRSHNVQKRTERLPVLVTRHRISPSVVNMQVNLGTAGVCFYGYVLDMAVLIRAESPPVAAFNEAKARTSFGRISAMLHLFCFRQGQNNVWRCRTSWWGPTVATTPR